MQQIVDFANDSENGLMFAPDGTLFHATINQFS